MNLLNAPSVRIVGIDLAWGEKNPDGVSLIWSNRERAILLGQSLTQGDAALLAWLTEYAPPNEAALLCIDAPLVVPNAKGSRPVDRAITAQFAKYHAGCYPANVGKCVRPLRVTATLVKQGYTVGHELSATNRLVAEVFPHPAMIHLFALDRIVKYKKGVVAEKRREFQRLQSLIKVCLSKRFPELEAVESVLALLEAPWSKAVEDQTDALVCALTGYLHWRDGGSSSFVVGDLSTGFILLPAPLQ